jgi:hypothetical protein
VCAPAKRSATSARRYRSTAIRWSWRRAANVVGSCGIIARICWRRRRPWWCAVVVARRRRMPPPIACNCRRRRVANVRANVARLHRRRRHRRRRRRPRRPAPRRCSAQRSPRTSPLPQRKPSSRSCRATTSQFLNLLLPLQQSPPPPQAVIRLFCCCLLIVHGLISFGHSGTTVDDEQRRRSLAALQFRAMNKLGLSVITFDVCVIVVRIF